MDAPNGHQGQPQQRIATQNVQAQLTQLNAQVQFLAALVLRELTKRDTPEGEDPMYFVKSEELDPYLKPESQYLLQIIPDEMSNGFIIKGFDTQRKRVHLPDDPV